MSKAITFPRTHMRVTVLVPIICLGFLGLLASAWSEHVFSYPYEIGVITEAQFLEIGLQLKAATLLIVMIGVISMLYLEYEKHVLEKERERAEALND